MAVQLPMTLVRLADLEDNIFTFLNDREGEKYEVIESAFSRLADRLYYNYMEGVTSRPLFRQETWLERYERLYDLCKIHPDLQQLLDQWHGAVGEYRMWISSSGLSAAEVLDLWSEVIEREDF
jgi:hypothetical protein